MKRYLFIGDLEKYKKGLSTDRARLYKRLLDEADRCSKFTLSPVPPKESTTYMGVGIANLALAHLLSGEEKYLREARRFMDTVMGWDEWGYLHMVNVDLSASWILFGLSLGYDWLKDELTEDECQRVRECLRLHARLLHDYRRDTYGHSWGSSFWQNHNWINMTGLAAAGYALLGECEEAQTYIDETRENFDRVFMLLADDGSNYEGVPYWRYGGMWLFVYAHLRQERDGTDWFQKSNYLKNTFWYRLYQSCADLRFQLNFGDSHDRRSGHPACVYFKTAAAYKNGYAQKLGNLVIDEFLEGEARFSGVRPGILPEAVFEFLWYDPSVPERDFADLPLTRYFEDLGLLTVRDGWGPDARVFSIKCGAPGGAKQWRLGWEIAKAEGIRPLSLSHHHPDNLSYLFTQGADYLIREDGYNRTILQTHHSNLLADGRFTDRENVSDVYMASVRAREAAEGENFDPAAYAGRVTDLVTDGSLTLYRGETSGIYPKELEMREASRLFVTDGLRFWFFVDVMRSAKPHTFEIIRNTDMPAELTGDGALYRMPSGTVRCRTWSDKPIRLQQYEQSVVSNMTPQEPDKLTRSDMKTLSLSSGTPETAQVFYECFTFEGSGAEACFENGVLTVKLDGRRYTARILDRINAGGCLAIEVTADGKRWEV